MLGFRVFVKLGEFFRSRSGFRDAVITRRDRSLGGKEVVVGNVSRGRVLESPLESREFTSGMFKGISRNWGKRKGNKLPQWWTESKSTSVSVVDDNEEYQRQANRLIRGLFISLANYIVNCVVRMYIGILLMTSTYHYI